MIEIQSLVGTLKISEDDVVTFPEGLLGFSDFKKFVFITDPQDDVFMWLQSCDQKDIAFPVIEAGFVADMSQMQLTQYECEKLNIANAQEANFYCMVRVASEATGMTANLKAPIVINKREHMGYQFVLANQNLQVQYPVFDLLRNKVREDADLL